MPISRFESHARRLVRTVRRPLLRRLDSIVDARPEASVARQIGTGGFTDVHHADESDAKAAHAHSSRVRAGSTVREPLSNEHPARLPDASVQLFPRSTAAAGAHVHDSIDSGPPVLPAIHDADTSADDERGPTDDHIDVSDVVFDAIVSGGDGGDGGFTRCAEPSRTLSDAVPPGSLGVQPVGAVLRGLVCAGG